MKDLRLPFHEIDFLIPAHKFKINFSYVNKKGFPFVRQFVLRLIHLSPVEPKNLADFFGFSERETKEAINNLIELQDLEYTDDGRLKLTTQSQSYFSDLGDIPLVSSLSEYGTVLSFDLADYNCVENSQIMEKWRNAFFIEIDPKMLSESEKNVRRQFQAQFYTLIEGGYLKGLDNEESSNRPSIYKMELVKKIYNGQVRVTQKLSLDDTGKQLERDDIAMLSETTEITGLITKTIHEKRKPDNKEDIFLAMDAIGDEYTKSLFSDDCIDVSGIITIRGTSEYSNTGYYPFLGPVYSRNNWEFISEHFETVLELLRKRHQDGIENLTWIAPADNFWGKSTRLESCFSELRGKSRVTGKKAKTLFNPVLYVPVSGADDKRSKGYWTAELPSHASYIHGLVEGFLAGNVEIIVLQNHFAVVCYHFSSPENYDVSVPLGFVTTNGELVSKITSLANDYITDFHGYEQPNDIGCIKSSSKDKLKLINQLKSNQ